MIKYKHSMEEKPIINARKVNKIRFTSGIVICILVIVLTSVVVALNLVDYFQYDTPESGLGNLRMFTTIANIIAAISASMCLPFQIDGLRRNRYKLPHWIALLMYIGTVGAFLTFFIALTLISSFQGFSRTMFEKSNIFFHTLNPILITTLFVVIIPDGHIKFSRSFIPMIPIGIYMLIYCIMVFGLNIWRDHYYTNSFIPWPVSLVLLIGLSFGICCLLRYLHNLMDKHIAKKIENYYTKSPDYEFKNISEAIAYLAKTESPFYFEGDDICIPSDLIQLLVNRYNVNDKPKDIFYDIYLTNYLISIGKKSK